MLLKTSLQNYAFTNMYFPTTYFILESTLHLCLGFIYSAIQFQDKTANNTTKIRLHRAYI